MYIVCMSLGILYTYIWALSVAQKVCCKSWPQLAKQNHSFKDTCSLPKVAKLRFYICGFRGDWKALRQLFNLSRDYSRNEAGFKKTKIQVANCFLDCVSILLVASRLLTLSDLLALPSHQGQQWRFRQSFHQCCSRRRLLEHLSIGRSLAYSTCLLLAWRIFCLAHCSWSPPCGEHGRSPWPLRQYHQKDHQRQSDFRCC